MASKAYGKTESPASPVQPASRTTKTRSTAKEATRGAREHRDVSSNVRRSIGREYEREDVRGASSEKIRKLESELEDLEEQIRDSFVRGEKVDYEWLGRLQKKAESLKVEKQRILKSTVEAFKISDSLCERKVQTEDVPILNAFVRALLTCRTR